MRKYSYVQPYHWVVEYCQGKFTRILENGRYRNSSGAIYYPVDSREQIVTLQTQEIITSDQINVKVSASVRWKVTDPVAYLAKASQPQEMIYVATQIAIREAVAKITALDLSSRSDALDSDSCLAHVRRVAEPLGIEVSQLMVKDIILPHELRTQAIELASVRAQANIKLEAARAETAALRALANAGKMLEQYPYLATLRLVQSLPANSRVNLTVGQAAADTNTTADTAE